MTKAPLRKDKKHPINEDKKKANFRLKIVAVPFTSAKEILNPNALFPALKDQISAREKVFDSFADCPYLINHAFFMLRVRGEDGVKHKPDLRMVCVCINDRVEMIRPEAFLTFARTKPQVSSVKVYIQENE